ncbi:hypothetical protein APA_2297 [Pseudanabaena sp. lw0831]|nr:hypothetical protein APA_2297 [Pseudanabaena sp. lw0831]
MEKPCFVVVAKRLDIKPKRRVAALHAATRLFRVLFCPNSDGESYK